MTAFPKFDAMKIIISGATRGIGKAIAIELASKGHQLILLARNKTALKNLASDLNTSKSTHEFIPIDLTEADQISKITTQLNTKNPVDLLINNLGVYELDQASKLEDQNLKQLLELNLFSAINLTQALLPLLRKSTASSIININSVMGIAANKSASAYSISKHALKAWNDSLREELRAEQIKVSSIYPGAVNTSSWDNTTANRTTMIQAEDIAKLVGNLIELGSTCLVEEIRLSPLNFKL